MSQLSQALILIVQTLGSLYLLIVLLRFILQLVRADFYNPLSQFIVRATHPLLRPLRRVIPSIGGLDLSSLLLAIIGVTGLFLNIFFYALIISVILSWVAPGSHNPGAQLVSQICEPALAPFRRLLPNMGGLDISPIFAFLAIKLLDMLVINNLAMMTHMPNILRSLI